MVLLLVRFKFFLIISICVFVVLFVVVFLSGAKDLGPSLRSGRQMAFLLEERIGVHVYLEFVFFDVGADVGVGLLCYVVDYLVGGGFY